MYINKFLMKLSRRNTRRVLRGKEKRLPKQAQTRKKCSHQDIVALQQRIQSLIFLTSLFFSGGKRSYFPLLSLITHTEVNTTRNTCDLSPHGSFLVLYQWALLHIDPLDMKEEKREMDELWWLWIQKKVFKFSYKAKFYQTRTQSQLTDKCHTSGKL